MVEKNDVGLVFLAHVRKNDAGKFVEHYLDDHSIGVAELARKLADKFGAGDWGYAVGLLHDLGKYSDAFQRYIKSKTGYYNPDAHIEDWHSGKSGKVIHSTAGAIHAIDVFGKNAGKVLAYIIAGHHGGLADWVSTSGHGNLSHRLQERDLLTVAMKNIRDEKFIKPASPFSKLAGKDIALWIRMLFSCLADADFLDTERFMNPEKAALRGAYPSLVEMKPKLDEYLQKLSAGEPEKWINKKRAEILCRCQEMANTEPGIFSLTVPTGGGKTLSSLAFAMDHAIKHGKDRVIYVIPYTSIIEQTGNKFREVFGDAVLEHHSNFDTKKETPESRIACENWDASLVVTTSVQFFESLFGNRTSRTRKLHNIVNSVVVLDEAQLLPPDFLAPIVGSIKELAKNYDVTFVLCTATQPALNSVNSFDFKFNGLDKVTEIMEDPDKLHDDFKRVDINFPRNFDERRTWEEISDELKQHDAVLCVVNSRTACRELWRLMPAGTIHLSALMCGAHRSDVIEEIKKNLKLKEEGKFKDPIRVISTQLVEAGVDIDFPVVYRAMAGLDSIAQAAGRCNREGRPEPGRVVVFVPPKPAPKGHLLMAEQSCRNLLENCSGDPLTRGMFMEYFNDLFWKKGETLDAKGILKYLNTVDIQFKTAAQEFQMINNPMLPVVVRYGEGSKHIEAITSGAPLTREMYRELQRYTVNIYEKQHERLVNKTIREIANGIFVQVGEKLYSDKIGLDAEELDIFDPEGNII